MHRVAYAIAWLASWPWVWRYTRQTRQLVALGEPLFFPLVMHEQQLRGEWGRRQLAELDHLAEGFADARD